MSPQQDVNIHILQPFSKAIKKQAIDHQSFEHLSIQRYSIVSLILVVLLSFEGFKYSLEMLFLLLFTIFFDFHCVEHFLEILAAFLHATKGLLIFEMSN